MTTMTANETEISLDELLAKAQEGPIAMVHRGRRIVLTAMPEEEYEEYEQFKRYELKRKLERGLKDSAEGRVVDGEEFFRALLNGEYDEDESARDEIRFIRSGR